MKISKQTQEILKNFASVNSNFYYSGEGEISTKTVSKTVFVKANVEESFTNPFGIYNLSEFLGALSMFSDPEVEFDETTVTIKQDRNSLRYVYAAKEVLDTPSEKVLQQLDKQFADNDPVAKFVLTEENIKAMLKAAAVLSLTDVLIEGDGSNITCSVINTQNPSSNNFSINVGETDASFKAYIKVENLKMPLTIYEVAISSKKIAQFVRHDGNYTMYIALERNSEI